MNNSKLLIGTLFAALSSGAVCSYASDPKVITLEEIFQSAEANSAQLRPYFTAEEEAGREISVTRSNRLPDINANLSVSYIGNGFTTQRDYSDFAKAAIPHLGTGLGLKVKQTLYTGGAITNLTRLAELKSTAARFATELQRNNIRFQLTGFYLDLYKYANLKSVVEKNISRAEEELQMMQARHEEGTALQNDITRYELLLSNLKLQLIKIENNLDILNENLVVTAGLEEGIKVIPDSTILNRSLPKDSEEWWQLQATDNSPRLGLANSGIEISRKAEALTQSERLPKIGVEAAWTLDGPILVEIPPINRNLSYWYIGFGVSYNLSSLYKSNKSLSKARATTRKHIEQLEAAGEDVSLAVRSDYMHYLESYQELLTQEKSLQLAEQNYATTSTRYNAGMALITDLLDAANSRLDAEQRLINARIDIIFYYYKLLFISGTI